MHEQWTDKLSDYLDGGLPPAERAAVEGHLAGCDACRAVLGELREVVASARELGPRPPERDLWPEIAWRTRRGVPRAPADPALPAATRVRRFQGMPGLIAASLVLFGLGSAATWLALGRGGAPAGPAAELPAPEGVSLAAETEAETFGATSAAVAELERVLADSRGRLEPETLRVIDENLRIIDEAIAEVRRALAEDPSSAYLNHHLADTLRRKLDLLRDAGELAARTL